LSLSYIIANGTTNTTAKAHKQPAKQSGKKARTINQTIFTTVWHRHHGTNSPTSTKNKKTKTKAPSKGIQAKIKTKPSLTSG